MFSVLVLLEDSKNVWSDHLPKKIGNPPAKNRFFHFRHAVSGDDIKQLAKINELFENVEKLVCNKEEKGVCCIFLGDRWIQKFNRKLI